MKTEKIIIITFWLVASGLWAMNIWGGWAERFYQKKKNDNNIWYWLRFFHIELTERNCILFIKGTSIAGLVLISIGSVIAIVFY
jgi:hypothetical protein